ncbi:MAG: NAD(P)-dependent oxidoreductase [Armatimonadota bacterium]
MEALPRVKCIVRYGVGVNNFDLDAAKDLDVFETEPLPASSPLRHFNNVLLTSHSASVSERAIEMLQIKAAEAARDFLCGKRPVSALV